MTVYQTDTAYELARNRLIPLAEVVADTLAGAKPTGDLKQLEEWNAVWNKAFHNKMDELVKEMLYEATD
jgi:hypothetical protein